MESQSEPIHPDLRLSIKFRDDYMLSVNCTSWCLFISVKKKKKTQADRKVYVCIICVTAIRFFFPKCELLF